jgi:hypothetical protein
MAKALSDFNKLTEPDLLAFAGRYQKRFLLMAKYGEVFKELGLKPEDIVKHKEKNPKYKAYTFNGSYINI